MNDDPKGYGRVAAWCVGVVLVLLVFYVLSIGPVAALVQGNEDATARVRVFYAPLIWLHDNTPLKTPLEKYVELWGAH